MKANLSWWHGGSTEGKLGYCIRFDYDRDVIQTLKDTIPWELREWNPTKKTWWIDKRAEKAMNGIFPGFLEQVISQKTLF